MAAASHAPRSATRCSHAARVPLHAPKGCAALVGLVAVGLGLTGVAAQDARPAAGTADKAAGTADKADGAAAAAAGTLAPHRAVYEITLDKASSGSGVSELTGRMVYELAGSACEGWTQNMRFVTRSTNQAGAAQINDLRTSSWEDAAGNKLRFDVSQYRDDALVETSQGDAARSEGSVGGKGGITVDLAKPERKKMTLDGNIYFPIRHSLTLLEAARAGRTGFTADLYDGAEKGAKVNHTNTVIGRKYAPGSVKMPAALKNGDKLDALASWPFAISYFDGGAKASDTAPSYELAFRFYENGVSTRLHIDYGEFSINGELSELTFMEPARCEAAPR